MSLFVYGVIEGEARPTLVAGHLGPVVRVESDGLAALCSEVGESPLGRRRELQAHVDVLGAACRQTSVVPMSFGVVFADEQQLKARFLVTHRAHLRREIDRLRDRVQLNLRLVADEQLLLADVVAGDPTLRAMAGSQVPPSRPGPQLRLGEAVADAYRVAGQRVGTAVVTALRPHAHDVRVEESGGQDAQTRAAFLVGREAVDPFLARSDQLAAALRGRFRCRVTGPLPPFSFVAPLRTSSSVSDHVGEAQWAS